MRARTRLADGRVVTRELVEAVLEEELARARVTDDGTGRWDDARDVLAGVTMGEDLPAFATTTAYARYLVHREARVPQPRADAAVTSSAVPARPEVSAAAALLALAPPVAALA
jgi:malate synthase